MNKRTGRILGLISFFGLLTSSLYAQSVGDYRSNAASFAWSVTANWQRFDGTSWVAPGAFGYPGQFATGIAGTVTIQSGHTVFANVGTTFSLGNLTINGTGTLSFAGAATIGLTGNLTMDGTSQIAGNSTTYSINVGGNFIVPATATNAQIAGENISVTGTSSISGTITFSNDTGVKTFTGAVTNSGAWTSTTIVTTTNLIFKGGISSTGGTFALGAATFNTNNQSISGSAAISFSSNVVVTGITVTNNNTNTLTMSSTAAGVLQGTGTYTQGNTSTLSYAGQTITVTTFNATNTGNTVNYTGNPVTVRGGNYYHLIYSGTGTANVGTTTTTVSGNLSVTNSGILNLNGAFTLAVAGNLTLDNTSQLTANAATGILTVAGTFSVPATATNAVVGTITLSVTGTTTVAGTLTLNSDTGVKTFIGAVSNSGSWTSTSVVTTGNLIFRNGIANTGTAFAAGTATFDTNAQSLSGTVAMSFANTLTVTGIALTNNNTSTVTLSNTGAGALTGTGSFVQGANSSLSYAGTTITITTFNATTNTPNLVTYTNATAPTTIVNFNSFTYSGGGTLTLASPNISGDLTVSSGTFSPSGTITFNGSAAQTISGAGTFTFASATLNTGTTNVNVNSSLSINGTLTFSTARILVVNSSSNITLGSAATISGASSTQYIQLDGSTGSNSTLIKTNSGATAQWQITYPIGTSTGGYTPITLTTVAGTAPTASSTLAVKAIYNSSNQGQLRRQFRLVVTGNSNATTLTSSSFTYNSSTDVSTGDAISNYSTLWYLASTSGSWTNPTGTAPGAGAFSVTSSSNLTSGTYFFTIGQSTAYPDTWYSYQTGVWSNWQNWTTDPSGSTLVNALNLPPQPGDAIVILNGITITNDVSGQVAVTTAINSGGTLDMSNTTGNTLGTVSGSGTLRIQGVALPSGTYTSFVTASTGGTIEYYNTTGTLPVAQTTYNHLKLTNSTASNVTFTETNNLTINGNFTITGTSTGKVTWQINDNTAAQRTITVAGDLTVGSMGAITAGTGNSGSTTPHSLTLSGNFTNSGTVQFFDPTSAPFTSSYTSSTVLTATTVGNAVNVTFSGASNATVTCSGQTDFYRFIVNKGTGQQAILTLNSTASTNMRLFGPANLFSTSNTSTGVSNCALSISNGTLQITGTLTIPTLIENGSAGVPNDVFTIPQTGALWLNSPNVSVTLTSNVTGANDDQRIAANGLLRISNGSTFIGGYSRGINSYSGGSVLIEGTNTTVSFWQYRPILGGSGIFTYTQTGGTVNVGTTGYNGTPTTSGPDDGIGGVTDQYARFSLGNTNSSFQMSGGTINIGSPTTPSGSALAGGLDIQSLAANYNVTGGTINVYIPQGASVSPPSGSHDFTINSTAPLYNLNIYRVGTNATYYATLNSSLTILNNLTLITGNSPTLNCNGKNVTIGGSLNIQASTTFNLGTSGTPVGTNTITFNGSGAQTWTYSGSLSNLSTVVVNKSAGTLTLAGNTLPTITTLTLTSGTMADGGNTVTVSTSLTNNATHTSSGSGSITYSGTAAIGGANGTFGNLIITAANSTIATSGNQTVTGNLQLNGTSKSILNIASYSLTVNGTISSTVGLGHNSYVQTSGLHNAGGLTRPATANTDILFPVGISTFYSPNTINVNNATTYGTITVRPVNSEHPNVTTTNISLLYYWRVTSSGFTLGASPSINHKTYTFNDGTAGATRNGTLTSYVAARYDRSANTWGYYSGAGQTMASKILPDPFNTGTTWTITGDQLDGEYTCGNSGAFGTIVTYYSRQSGNWNVNATWSTVAVGGAAASSNPTSCATCPVIIGDAATNNHVITTVAASSCGSLTLSSGSTLDCGTFTGHNFGTNTGGSVSGTGLLRIGATGAGVSNMFPAGDFTNFLGTNGGTVEWYGGTKTIPATGPAPQNLTLNTYYNLVLNPSAANTITLPASNLTIYNNLTEGNTAGFTGTAVTNGSRTISVTGNFAVSLGTFNFSNANPSVTTLTVTGNTTVASGATLAAANGGTANVNTFSTAGNITNNGTINFNNTAVVNLTFTGSSNTTFSGSGNTTLNLVTLNKGTSASSTLTCSLSGTLGTTAVAAGWLTLTNGTFDFEYTGVTSPITLSTSSYTIPSTTKLKVGGGTIRLTSASGGTNDLFLNGTLEVASSGVVYTNTTTATGSDNDIEYAATGTPTITVSGGTLTVDGQVRRSTSILVGALVYNQSGGTVTVGGNAPNNTRGIFEIDNNAGSSFTMTGTSNLIIQRPTNGSGSYADLYINPVSSSVTSGATISVGLATGASAFKVNVAPTIGNFTLIGSSSAYSATLYSNNLVLLGNLTINANATLITTSSSNNYNVSIAGNLAGTGTYNGSANTTTFNGTAAQSGALTATSNFNNMTISNTGGGTVTLSGTAPTLKNLNILNGILDVGSLALNVNGDMTNNSSQVASGGGSITVTTTTTASHTITSSSGSFTNLIIGGATAATANLVTVTGNMSINGYLDFNSTSATRYLFIGSSQLTFGTTAVINNAGTTTFIKTNGNSSDLGVVKNWGLTTTSFTYAVGTRTNYTPVLMGTTSAFSVSVAGSLTVVPVDAIHPTANPDGTQILDYYWKVIRDNTFNQTNNTGSLKFQVPTALIGGASGTLNGYYLDAINLIGWAQGGSLAVAGGNETLTFSSNLNSGNPVQSPAIPPAVMPAANGEFDYTFGTSTNMLNPITPVYSRFGATCCTPTTMTGSWSAASGASWTTSSTGYGAAYGTVPSGRPVVILAGATINLDVTGQKAFSTVISSGGILNVSTTGHNMGTLSGTGTLQVSTSRLPAGTYTTFVSTSGGTIEYTGAVSMDGVTTNTYNNLKISSTVAMTSANLTINGNLTIGAGNTLDNSTGNANISIAGTWSNSGTFTPGTGTVTFNGSAAQSTVGTTTFNNLTINKPTNLTLGNTTTVNGVLTLTSGTIISNSSPSTPLLQLGYSASTSGGSSSSFVSGQIRKCILSGSSFTFPLGSTAVSRYRPASVNSTSANDCWDASYIGNNPSNDGYPYTSYNSANMAKVSMYEYWLVSNQTGTTSAGLTLSFDVGSYGGADIGALSSLETARWNGTQWDIPPGGGSFSQTGTNVTGTVSVSTQSLFSPQTIATTDVTSSLPVSLLTFTGKQVDEYVELNWKTASELNNNFFTVLKSVDGEKFNFMEQVKGQGTTNIPHAYNLSDHQPVNGINYYSLHQTDFDGTVANLKTISVDVVLKDAPIKVYPNPVNHQDALNIEVRGLSPNQAVDFQIVNVQGVTLQQATGQANPSGLLTLTYTPKEIPPGLYVLKVGGYKTKIVVR